MRFGRWIPAVLLLVAAAFMLFPVGCKRSYPITPMAPLTSTPTPAGTSTFTRTATATVTNTKTNTPTITWTGQPTATRTFTATFTLSPTQTFTQTPTLTPLPPVGIDNLEDGDGVINLLPGVGTAGSWFTTSDGTCSTVFPDPAGAFLPYANGSPLGGSLYSAHLTGTGCSTFGAIVGFNFIAPVGGIKQMYDVSSYSGIRFDIRQISGTVSSVRFSMPGGFTEPAATGGYCAANCNGHWGQDLIISTTWQPVTVWEAWMTQPSWAPAGQPFDPWESFGLQWQANAAAGQNFGFEVDNIAFVNETAPPTPTPDCKPIDNLEDSDNTILNNCNRSGSWYSYDDVANNGGNTVTWPPAGAPFLVSGPGLGANGTQYSAHLTGVLGAAFASRFTGMGFNFFGNGGPYNIGVFNGISFYAKCGTNLGADPRIKMKLPNADTNPGTVCTNCYDNHRVQLDLTQNWTLYKVDFVSGGPNLYPTQEGWGVPQVAFNPVSVFGVQFQSDALTPPNPTGDIYDFWVDEVNFY